MRESLISSIKKTSYGLSTWFEKQSKRITVPLLTSLTIKDGGIKASISDTQLFPIGLNNLCKTDLKNASHLIKKYFKQYHSDISNLKRVMILATTENANPFYYEHLYTLTQLFKKAKLEATLATLEPLEKPVAFTTPTKKVVKIMPTLIEKRRLKTNQCDPDFIFLTHSFPCALTAKLSEIQQAISPPLKVLPYMETQKIKKSDYFLIFNKIAGDFAELAHIDPWLFKTEFQVENHVNFDERSGVEKIAHSAEILLNTLGTKYKEYHIDHSPSVLVLNNGGTYGMGMISIDSTKKLADLYHQKKAKKTVGKNQSIINDVLIQEEIPGSLLYKKFKGETVIYLIGNEVAGGYIKTYADHTASSILSSRQHLFLPICLTGKTHTHPKKQSDKNITTLYSTLARLGGIATGYHIDKMPC